jgi:hypothetical protein
MNYSEKPKGQSRMNYPVKPKGQSRMNYLETQATLGTNKRWRNRRGNQT